MVHKSNFNRLAKLIKYEQRDYTLRGLRVSNVFISEVDLRELYMLDNYLYSFLRANQITRVQLT